MFVRRVSFYLLLTAGIASITYGLLGWQLRGFTLFDLSAGFWPWSAQEIHPLYFIILGIAFVPATLWELIANETAQNAASAPLPVSNSERDQA
ncbi:MAG TPA: hypothetical protein DER02_05755 [Gammaproteobacteria bacterium]|nr:hypothetical protein [Gammaproteobacteria bacterium]|tara:strand:- start:5464 stop:5742 length:279 start_codon:yes stop_codon:yes gene_type:complete